MSRALPLATLLLCASCIIVPESDSPSAPAEEPKSGESPTAETSSSAPSPSVAAVNAPVRDAAQLAAEEPKTEEPETEQPKAEQPKADGPKAEEPKAEEPKAEEPKADEPISCEIKLAGRPAIDASIGERFPELGAPCAKLARSAKATGAANLRCGVHGRVAAVFGPGDALINHPEKVTALKAPQVPATKPKDGSAKLSVGGRFLYATILTCPHCRRQLGWSVVVDLRTIRDSDLAAIQKALGYPASPLLRTARTWSAAVPTKDAAGAPPILSAPLCR